MGRPASAPKGPRPGRSMRTPPVLRDPLPTWCCCHCTTHRCRPDLLPLAIVTHASILISAWFVQSSPMAMLQLISWLMSEAPMFKPCFGFAVSPSAFIPPPSAGCATKPLGATSNPVVASAIDEALTSCPVGDFVRPKWCTRGWLPAAHVLLRRLLSCLALSMPCLLLWAIRGRL